MSNCVDIPLNKNLSKTSFLYDFDKTPFKNNFPPSNKPNWSFSDYNKYNCETPPEFYAIFDNMNKNIKHDFKKTGL